MKFTWRWYVAALGLFLVRNWFWFFYLSDPGVWFQLVGAFLGNLLIIYVVFYIYRWYKLRVSVE